MLSYGTPVTSFALLPVTPRAQSPLEHDGEPTSTHILVLFQNSFIPVHLQLQTHTRSQRTSGLTVLVDGALGYKVRFHWRGAEKVNELVWSLSPSFSYSTFFLGVSLLLMWRRQSQ